MYFKYNITYKLYILYLLFKYYWKESSIWPIIIRLNHQLNWRKRAIFCILYKHILFIICIQFPPTPVLLSPIKLLAQTRHISKLAATSKELVPVTPLPFLPAPPPPILSFTSYHLLSPSSHFILTTLTSSL